METHTDSTFIHTWWQTDQYVRDATGGCVLNANGVGLAIDWQDVPCSDTWTEVDGVAFANLAKPHQQQPESLGHYLLHQLLSGGQADGSHAAKSLFRKLSKGKKGN